jgi:regulatory protein
MKSPAASGRDIPAARAAAVALLARRDFASAELRSKLERQGFDAGVIGAAIALLAREGVLDDARYAGNYVGYHAGRGHGPLRIAAALRAVGVSGELIDGALAAGPDWRALTREVRIRKFGVELPTGQIARARQARFLQYRGFSSDHIRLALGADFDPD